MAPDVELVAVDDASPDHGPELLDALAARDERVRVLHLRERGGLGAGRDAGLAQATGDFVWFVHAPDRPAPGALAAVAERLRTLEPDVLLVDHARVDALGRERPGPHRGLLGRVAEDGTTTLDRRPGLAAAAPRAFDKVFRRAALDALGTGFSDGEPAVLWPALLAAERIAAAPEARLLRYAPPNARAPEDADVFAAYDAVFAFLAAHPEIPDARRRLVLPGDRPARARRARAACPPSSRRRTSTRCRLSGSATGAATSPRRRAAWRGCDARLVERGDLLGHRAAARGARPAQGALPPPAHARPARPPGARRSPPQGAPAPLPRAPATRRSTRTSPSSPPTGTAATPATRARSTRRRASSCPGCAASGSSSPTRSPRCPAGVEHVVARHARVLRRDRARARTSSTTSTSPTTSSSAPGTVHVMTHHGTPLKRMGLDLRDAHGRRPADGLRRAAAPLRALGLQRLLERRSRRSSGSASIPVPLRVARGRLPAQRRARRPPPATTSRRIRAEPRHRAGPARRALRADPPRVPARATCRCSTSPRSPTGSARTTSCWPGCTTSTAPTRICAELHRAGADPRRRRAPLGRGAVPGRGRARHRLLLAHVRLRRARPPDRDPRARLGGLPDAARHLLRPAGGAARAPSRAPRTS